MDRHTLNLRSDELHAHNRFRVRRILGALILIAFGVLSLVVRNLSWDQIEQSLGHGPQCVLKSWTGLLCSFCGMTHSWIALLKGDWSRAVHENALGIPLFGFTVAAAVAAILKPSLWLWNRFAVWASIAVLVIYFLLRNLGL